MDAVPAESTRAALLRFVERFAAVAREAGTWPPRAEHDAEWPLRCALGPPDERGTMAWAPTARDVPPDFTTVDRAIGPLHPDVKEYFGSLWSLTLVGLHRGEPVYLATFENEERESEVLRGWLRAGRGVAVCVAHFGDDRWVGVDVTTGRVSLQDPGRPMEPIAGSLAEWLDSLQALPAW